MRYKYGGESVSEDESEVEKIYRSGNRVYFYEDISRESVIRLKEELEKTMNECVKIGMEYKIEPRIELHLYSNGGDVFMGLDVYNFIKRSEVAIDTYIDGMIASAATFIYLGGEKRFISEYNHMLIHQLSTSFWGKYEDLSDEFKNSKSLMECIKDLYKQNTTIPKKILDELLRRELLLNTDECLKYKIATDKI